MTLSTEEFYDQISEDYDDFTKSDERFTKIQKTVKSILKKYHMRNALDAACGTGLFAIALKQSGVNVTGADISGSMLDKAVINAQQFNLNMDWLQVPMQQIKNTIRQKFDAVFCLGNSLPHLLTPADLESSLDGFYSVLKPGGVLMIQILNYKKILKEKSRIINITKKNDTEYIRFYDFTDKLLKFNLLKIQWHNNKAVHKLTITELFPYDSDTLKQGLNVIRFAEIELYGNLIFDPFLEDQSSNLIMICHKDI